MQQWGCTRLGGYWAVPCPTAHSGDLYCARVPASSATARPTNCSGIEGPPPAALAYASLLSATYVVCCSNAIWWGAYGFWQRLIWQQLARTGSSSQSTASMGAIVGVQAAAGVLSGCTAALITNPLDLDKTRLQVGSRLVVGLLSSEGLAGAATSPAHCSLNTGVAVQS
eukprot:GHUV01039042.1.p2 GENE.GHUV01039042.1~~GHUV01039042.1.p2  ORF type:complete len:169 (+),score=38.72 GHUV01039042.1:351-857(+)